jgi:hypothetical protein
MGCEIFDCWTKAEHVKQQKSEGPENPPTQMSPVPVRLAVLVIHYSNNTASEQRVSNSAPASASRIG